MNRHAIAALVSAAGAVVPASVTHAQVAFWTGAGDGENWTDSANWSGNAVPNGLTDVYFGPTVPQGTVTIEAFYPDPTFAVKSFTFGTGSDLWLTGRYAGPEAPLVISSGLIRQQDNAGNEGDITLSFQDGIALGANGLLDINGNGSVTVFNLIEMGGSRSLTKAGNGVARLGYGIGYTGATNVNQGILSIYGSNLDNGSPVQVAAGATLRFEDFQYIDFYGYPAIEGGIADDVRISGTGDAGRGAIEFIGYASTANNVRLTGSASVSVTNGSVGTINGLNAAGYSFFKEGQGELRVQGTTSLASSTYIDQGTLRFLDPIATTGGSFSVAAGAQLAFDSATKIDRFTMLGEGSILAGGGGEYAGVVSLQGDATIKNMTLSGLITDGLYDPYALTLEGATRLTTANSHRGGTKVIGHVKVENAGAFGTGDVDSLGIVQLMGGLDMTNTANLFGGAANGYANLTNEQGNNAWSGQINIAQQGSVGSRAGLFSVTGDIAGAGQLRVASTEGELSISGHNTYTGGTKVDSGVVYADSDSAFGTGTVTIAQFSPNAAVALRSGTTHANGAVIKNAGKDGLGAIVNQQGTNTWAGDITLAADAAVGSTTGNLRLTGKVLGDHTLSKVGDGLVTLGGAAGGYGGLDVTDGILRLEGDLGVKADGSAHVRSGASIEAAGGTNANETVLDIVGSGHLGTGALRAASGLRQWDGEVRLDANGGSVGAVSGSRLTIAGNITEAAPGSKLTKLDHGTVRLVAANTYTGGTEIKRGVLEVVNDSNLGAAESLVEINGSGRLRAVLDMTTGRTFEMADGGSIEVAAAHTLTYKNAEVYGGTLRGLGTHVFDGGNVINGNIVVGAHALQGTSVEQYGGGLFDQVVNSGFMGVHGYLDWTAGSNTAAGSVWVTGDLNAVGFENYGNLTVTTDGHLNNSGLDFVSAGGGHVTTEEDASINLGGTTMRLQGSLFINNGVVRDGTVLVDYGAHAGGTGIYEAAVVVANGGVFGPGNSPGAVTLATLDQRAGGLLAFELAGLEMGTRYDHATILGEAILGGGLSVEFTPGFTASMGDSFDLFDWGSITGQFADVYLPTLNKGLRWDDSELYTSGRVCVVPSPASVVLLGLGSLIAVPRRRK